MQPLHPAPAASQGPKVIAAPGSSSHAAVRSVWSAHQQRKENGHEDQASTELRRTPNSACPAFTEHCTSGHPRGLNNQMQFSKTVHGHAPAILQHHGQAGFSMTPEPLSLRGCSPVGSDASGVFDEPGQPQSVAARLSQPHAGLTAPDSTRSCSLDADASACNLRGRPFTVQQSALTSLPSTAAGIGMTLFQGSGNQQQQQQMGGGSSAVRSFHTPPTVGMHARTPPVPASTQMAASAAGRLRFSSVAGPALSESPDAQHMPQHRPEHSPIAKAAQITSPTSCPTHAQLSAGTPDHDDVTCIIGNPSQELLSCSTRTGPLGRHSLPPAASSRFKPANPHPSAPPSLQQSSGMNGPVSTGTGWQHTAPATTHAAQYEATENEIHQQLHTSAYQPTAGLPQLGSVHDAGIHATHTPVMPDWPDEIPQLQQAGAQALLHDPTLLPSLSAGQASAETQPAQVRSLVPQQRLAAEQAGHVRQGQQDAEHAELPHASVGPSRPHNDDLSKPWAIMQQSRDSQGSPAGKMWDIAQAGKQDLNSQPEPVPNCSAGQGPQSLAIAEPRHLMHQPRSSQVTAKQLVHGHVPGQPASRQPQPVRPDSAGKSAAAADMLGPRIHEQQIHRQGRHTEQVWHTPLDARPLKRQHTATPSDSFPTSESRGFQISEPDILKNCAISGAERGLSGPSEGMNSCPDSFMQRNIFLSQGVFGTVPDEPGADMTDADKPVSRDLCHETAAEEVRRMTSMQGSEAPSPPEPCIEVVLEWIREDLADLETFLLEQPQNTAADPPVSTPVYYPFGPCWVGVCKAMTCIIEGKTS